MREYPVERLMRDAKALSTSKARPRSSASWIARDLLNA